MHIVTVVTANWLSANYKCPPTTLALTITFLFSNKPNTPLRAAASSY